jgi:hypothetical protein
VADVLDGFGYFGVIFEWLWISVIILPPLLKAGFFNFLIQLPKNPPAVAPYTETSPFLIGLAGIITIIVLLITVYAVVRLPLSVMQTGETVSQKTAQKIVPIVVHHHKKAITPAKKKRLTRQLRFFLCIAASLVPVCLTFFAPSVKLVPINVVLFVETFLAFCSVGLFAASYAVRQAR